MLYTSFHDRPNGTQRQGVVLLIVITMLALFATVALAFVFYAEAEAVASQTTAQAQSKTIPDADSELLLSYFLSQLIYGTNNLNSAMRGHDFGTTMFGNNPNGLNVVPYSGSGRMHYNNPALGSDDYLSPNYQYYPADGFIRDPEFYYDPARTSPATPRNPALYRAGNAPYTSPDLNSMFLGSVNANGEVIQQSFYRSWTGVNFAKTNPKTDGAQKYLTVTPHGVYHPGFDPNNPISPPDWDKGGHVRNLDFSKGFKYVVNGQTLYANNDSYWLDLGWPVIIAPNGQKYKALFAPLIIDLDNRVNMWMSGNQRSTGSTGGTHVSHKGYGVTEINLSSIVTNAAELNQLISVMRYKGAGGPSYVGVPAQWPQRDGPISFRIDFDAFNGGPLTLPNPNNPQYASAQYFIWPDFPNGTYAAPAGPNPPWFSPITGKNVTPDELLKHPLGYTIANPGANNPLPPASNMEAILRHMGTGAPAVTSGFFKSMPATFNNTRNRGLLTTHSWNIDRITAAPYIPFDPSNGAALWTYSRGAGSAYPTLNSVAGNVPTALSSPSFAGFAPGTPTGPQVNSEFSAGYASALANRLRVNLNRLSQFDYPTPDNTGFIDLSISAIANQFNSAQGARLALARDIYNVLVLVTGAQDPNLPANATLAVGSPQYAACRWLAQLAVNIVDYIDNDDITTPFQWYTDSRNPAQNPAEFVYGTEAPRLVINEAYTQLDDNYNDFVDGNGNLVNDASKWNAISYNLNVWAELHNPFKSTPAGETYPLDGGVARTTIVPPASANVAPYAAYEITVSQPDANLRAQGGNARNRGTSSAGAALKPVVRTWGPANTAVQVNPANGAFSDPSQTNVGFFVLGPATTFLPSTPIGLTGVNTPATNPNLPVTFASPQMSVSLNAANQMAAINNVLNKGTTLLLRRLACPYLPPSATNPYITVDYVENIKTWDNRVAKTTVDPNALPGPVTANSSIVRKEPYAASYMGTNRNPANASAQYVGANPPAGQAPNQPLNTLFRHNSIPNPPAAGDSSTFRSPFNWLVHLDRPVINGIELLHVSGYRPHELTQQFVPCTVAANNAVSEGVPFQHYAPWPDQSAMIFRVLEFLGVPSYLNGATMGGRVPGKININTLNELEVFLALCDPNAVSSFNMAFATQAFNNMVLSRTPGDAGAPQPIPAGTPSSKDQPFKGFATGWVNAGDSQYPLGGGLQDTLLRPYPAGGAQSLFKNPAVSHPYQQWELLQKIQNNVTTTSHLFAVWLTVGFFEVDDSFTPAKIGAEIGRDQGRHIRHRMFSIVDRSQLQLFTPGTGNYSFNPMTSTGTLTLTTPPVGVNLPQGTTLLLDVTQGTTTEVVSVTASANNSWTFTVTLQTIGNGAVTIGCRGNPGPQQTYNPRNDPGVVPHFTIIQ